MPFIRGKNGQKGRTVWRANCRHCQVLDEYQAAKDAWEALRWSGESCGGAVAGTAGSGVSYMQLSDDEYRQIFPMPLFKDFLVAAAQEVRHQEPESQETETSANWWPQWPDLV